MKKLALLFSIVTTFTFAQNKTKDELLKVVTQETCDCLSTKELNDDNLEMQLGLCMMQSISNYQSDFDALYGKDALLDQEIMYEFGKSLGMRMVGVCPQIFTEHMDKIEEMADVNDSLVFEGKITKIENEPFYTIYIKERSGSEMKFIVLENFGTVNDILNNKITLKDQVRVTYYQNELYDVKIKEFAYFNILTGISK